MLKAAHPKNLWLAILAALVYLAGAAFHISAASPTLSILSPTSHSQVYGSKVTVNLSVTDFKLVDYKTYPKPVSGQGHVHLWIDTPNPTKESAIKLTTNSYTFENLKPGTHTLVAELVSNNHSSFTPPITTTLEFTTSKLNSSESLSLFDHPVFQLTLFTVVLICVALYFTNMHINNVFDKSHTKKAHSKTTSKSSKKKSK